MSFWKEISKEDIELDGDEVNVLIDTDNNGNVYATLKVSDLREILKVDEEIEEAIWNATLGAE